MRYSYAVGADMARIVVCMSVVRLYVTDVILWLNGTG